MREEEIMKTTHSRPPIAGNRMALTGAVLYLLEWVALLGSGLVGVEMIGGAVGAPPTEVMAAYSGTETGMALVAAWMGIVLTGRVLLLLGLQRALRGSGRDHPLMGFAVALMSISVALEVAAMALYAGAARLAAESYDQAMLALDRGGTALSPLTVGLGGLSVLCAAWCLARSGLFPVILNVLGFIGGAGLALTPFFTAPALEPVLVVLGFAALFFWAWMIWAGILLWRHAPALASEPAEPVKI
jgi:hypothetical protein